VGDDGERGGAWEATWMFYSESNVKDEPRRQPVRLVREDES